MRQLVEDGRVELHTSFTITGFKSGDSLVVIGSTPDGEVQLDVDLLIPATGFRPDLDMLREVRLELDPTVEAPRELGPLIDPEFHSCGTVPPHGAKLLAHPDHDFYIAGMKSYCRAPTFLLATGYEQVRSIAAALAGDSAAADNVELDLPETGVCSTDIGSAAMFRPLPRPRNVSIGRRRTGSRGSSRKLLSCAGTGSPRFPHRLLARPLVSAFIITCSALGWKSRI